ncbi:MAG: zinc-binding dehydrogenase, partial [Acidiferrobacterales bacterium]
TGAGGRVGFYAVQWAKQAGAQVIATVGNEDRARQAREAGADTIVNYRSDDVAETVNQITNGAGVDRIIDVEFGANLQTSVKIIRTGGVIATYSSTQVPEPGLPVYPFMFKDVTVHFVLVYVMPESAKRQAAADIVASLGQGKLTHRIAARYPLARISEAHTLVEQGSAAGCVVLEFS